MCEIGESMKENVVNGYNSCIFAYGQTGSGKTFSILGTDMQHERQRLAKIKMRNRRRHSGCGALWEPVFSGKLQKLKQEGNIMEASHWFHRDFFISANGSLLYRSVRDSGDAPLVYYTDTDLQVAVVRKVPQAESAMPWTFEVALLGGDELAIGAFSAPSEIERDQWIRQLSQFRASAEGDDLRGLLPRIVEGLFVRIAGFNESEGEHSCTCSVQYLEIYNEQLRDLLVPFGQDPPKLKIRASPTLGVYVQGVRTIPVFTHADVASLLELGAKARTVAATSMNAQSSRSHCVFSLEFRRQITRDDGVRSTLHSKFVSVDLAGSERQKKANTSGLRLKEASQINQGLSQLALVISKLADMEVRGHKSGDEHVSFRNSKLTHMLQNCLSGNSKTVMLAAVSPSIDNWEESHSTLRFAESVKKIRTKVSKNEQSNESVIAALRREIEQLKTTQGKMDSSPHESPQIRSSRLLKSGSIRMPGEDVSGELEALESMMESFGHDFKTQLQIAHEHRIHCDKALEDMGLSLKDMSETVGLNASTPQLVNCSHDPSLQGCLVYFLDAAKEKIRIGSDRKSCGSGIVIQGLGIAACNCVITNGDNLNPTILPVEGRVLVNGRQLSEETLLRHGDRLILGYSHCFRVVIPEAAEDVAAQERDWANLDEALKEVKPGTDENCHMFAEAEAERLGAAKAQAFLHQFQMLSHLVEEANAIAAEVWPEEHLSFSVEILTDLQKYESDVPECIVRLRRLATRPDSRTSSALKLTEKLNSTIVVFDESTFTSRVDLFREAYETSQSGAPQKLHFDDPAKDPWCGLWPWETLPVSADQSPEIKFRQTDGTPECRCCAENMLLGGDPAFEDIFPERGASRSRIRTFEQLVKDRHVQRVQQFQDVRETKDSNAVIKKLEKEVGTLKQQLAAALAAPPLVIKHLEEEVAILKQQLAAKSPWTSLDADAIMSAREGAEEKLKQHEQQEQILKEQIAACVRASVQRSDFQLAADTKALLDRVGHLNLGSRVDCSATSPPNGLTRSQSAFLPRTHHVTVSTRTTTGSANPLPMFAPHVSTANLPANMLSGRSYTPLRSCRRQVVNAQQELVRSPTASHPCEGSVTRFLSHPCFHP